MSKFKDRTPKGAPQYKQDDFISRAQVRSSIAPEATVNPYDPNEPRTQTINGKTKAHKTIGLQFNRYEWWALEQAVKKSKRSVNSIIREGIQKELNSIE